MQIIQQYFLSTMMIYIFPVEHFFFEFGRIECAVIAMTMLDCDAMSLGETFKGSLCFDGFRSISRALNVHATET